MIPIMVVVGVMVAVIVKVETSAARRRRDFDRRLAQWYDDERVCNDVDD